MPYQELILDPDIMELIPSFPGTPNELIRAKRQAKIDEIKGPKVGDFVHMDGRLNRFCIEYDDSLQTTPGGSFYLGHTKCDYSGGCDPSVPVYRLIPTGERKPGNVWFFDKDEWGAGRGIHTEVMFNVWELVDFDHLNDQQQKQRSKRATTKMVQAVNFWGYNHVKSSANY